jgi:4,5-DOPA dioxygenase extradiol
LVAFKWEPFMNKMPSLFVSHGAPTYATEPGLAGAQLRALGKALDKPQAVLIVSPHWMTADLEITATSCPETIHDFGGFPKELYALQYPVAGSPELAISVQKLLQSKGIPASLDTQRGLDHGAWVPLLHLYPDADIPVIQVSLPVDADEVDAFALGQALAPLAREGVLVIGSGSLTHNLYEYQVGEVLAAPYAQEFSAWVREAVRQGDMARLLKTLRLAPHAARAHPSTEHFLPLLVAAGAANNPGVATVLDGGIRHGILAMESYVFGLELPMNY